MRPSASRVALRSAGASGDRSITASSSRRTRFMAPNMWCWARSICTCTRPMRLRDSNHASSQGPRRRASSQPRWVALSRFTCSSPPVMALRAEGLAKMAA